ncbi:MAG: hypothetical protein FJ292_05945 [Planctomycetes bacterium]|nr:hypothetical protein [Planctomycetota bacterium]
MAAAALCTSAQAGVIVTNNQSLWTGRVTTGGQVVGTESFSDFANGLYSAPVSGTLGNVVWTASAAEGLYVEDGYFSTNLPVPLTFTFNPGVRAVAGNIFGTDLNFNVVTCVVSVTLSNGITFEGISSSPTDFVGFYSTTTDISSMTIVTSPLVTGSVFATIDNLYLAVPAPGAAALIGLAGLVARRRRA